jgi:hypothetical protein
MEQTPAKATNMAMMVLPLIALDLASGDAADVTDTWPPRKVLNRFLQSRVTSFNSDSTLNLAINLNGPKWVRPGAF